MGSCLLNSPEGCKYVPTANGSQANSSAGITYDMAIYLCQHPLLDNFRLADDTFSSEYRQRKPQAKSRDTLRERSAATPDCDRQQAQSR